MVSILARSAGGTTPEVTPGVCGPALRSEGRAPLIPETLICGFPFTILTSTLSPLVVFTLPSLDLL
jgi:hypothetical protein